MKKDVIGRWRLTKMSNWDNEFMDEESPAFCHIDDDGRGEFHFGYVWCQLDWVVEDQKTMPGVAFTFEGNDEMHPTTGRGWAALQADGTLMGHIFFHQGDDSEFWAKRKRG